MDLIDISTRMARGDGDAVDVRRAAPGDERAVRDLFRALHAFNAGLEARFALADGWERELASHLAQERATDGGLTLLAWQGAEPVGLAMVAGHEDSPLFRTRRWPELTALYVAPGVRGAGVADRLLEAGLAWAAARGHAEVRLYVTATNARARRFYGRSGFRPIQEIWTADLGSASAVAPAADGASREAA